VTSETWERLIGAASAGEIAQAAQILVENRSDPDLYSIALAALAASSTYGCEEGKRGMMAEVMGSPRQTQ
jgi:hypothetical protein